jgi:hypothetical protein
VLVVGEADVNGQRINQTREEVFTMSDRLERNKQSACCVRVDRSWKTSSRV